MCRVLAAMREERKAMDRAIDFFCKNPDGIKLRNEYDEWVDTQWPFYPKFDMLEAHTKTDAALLYALECIKNRYFNGVKGEIYQEQVYFGYNKFKLDK